MDIFKSFFAGRVEEIFIKFNDNVEEYIKIPGKILLWVFLSLLIFFLFYAIRFDGLTKIDAMDTAQIARNVATGEGFTTKLIRPYALTVSPDIVDHPELTAPPLYTMVLAGMFRVFGATDRVVALTSSLFYLLSIPLIFLMACKLFDSKTAFLTLALYITNSAMLDYSISGLPMSFLIFMFMLFLFVLYYLNEESVLITLLAGLLLGLCFLSQYAYGLLYFVVVFHIMSSFESKKIRHIVYFTLIFVLSISPWLYRNYVVTGNPFYTLEFYKSIMFSNIFPGNSFLRIVRDINIPNKALGLALVQKTYYGIQALYRQIIFLPNNYLMVLFLVSLFVLYENV